MGGFYPHVERGRPKSTPPGNFPGWRPPPGRAGAGVPELAL